MRVPEVTSPDYECSEGAITVEHVLMKCSKWSTEREELITPLHTTSVKEVLTLKVLRHQAATRDYGLKGQVGRSANLIWQGQDPYAKTSDQE
ncbi:hypothetical protein GJ744_002640 [Endocarpon pusillum]|uniref:Uncharacterized protein n=1 Tax=Endocarpon pusillum TaxID=364733 RepID=A0A8H7ABN4_9EURO|nr:hypothetical protein GJ744_002640 [Endocarpon pusillum]